MSLFLERLAGWQSGNIPILTSIVGDRIHPVEAPAGEALPYMVYTMISHNADIHHGGRSGWATMRVQYDVFARQFYEANDAERAVRDAFEGQSLEIATGTQICFATIESCFDEYDAEEKIYRRSFDLLFEYIINN